MTCFEKATIVAIVCLVLGCQSTQQKTIHSSSVVIDKSANNIRFIEDRSNYDLSNPAFNILQSPNEGLSHLPLDSYGAVDWVTALEKGVINPRKSLSENGTMRRRATGVLMKNTRAMPYVLFPHSQHTQWLDCDNCHPTPFAMEQGSSKITMDDIMRGDACGLCHDRVAFSIIACERCHSITHPGSPIRWW